MKNIYSFILLFSFLAGIIYPVTPMVQYYLSGDNELESCDISLQRPVQCECCSVTVHHNARTCGECDTHNPQSLLDVDHFPIPLLTNHSSARNILLVLTEHLIIRSEHAQSYITPPVYPPPRTS